MISWHERAGAWLPRAGIIAHDLFMVWLCWIVLHQFRLSMQPVPMETPLWSTATLIVVAAQGLVLWRVGLYRGVWRFASVPDLVNILKASVFGLLAILIALFLYNRLELVPRTVLVLYPVALTALLGMPRLLYRSWKDHSLARTDQSAVRVLILGAGQAGEALLRDLRRTGAYQAVGFLDDAAKLRGSYLQGVPVLGRVDEVETIAPETAAKLLVIAMPSADAPAMRRVVAACERTGLPFRTVPRLNDLLEGRSLPGELKEVAIEDLLGRKPVMPDWKAIRAVKEAVSIPVIANGDMTAFEDVTRCLAESGADGVMIGRGTYGRPWFIGQVIHYLRTGERLPDPRLEDQLATLIEHYEAMLEHYGTDAGVKIARKHVSWYSKGLPGSAEFRAEVNRVSDPAVVLGMIRAFYSPEIERMAA